MQAPTESFLRVGVVDSYILKVRSTYIVLHALPDSSLSDIASGNWVDLVTGGGAIALGLAEVLPNATIYGVDPSQKALAIASSNAIELGFDLI